MVKPGGTGRPRFAISARPAPLPPSNSRMLERPSALPPPKTYTHCDLDLPAFGAAFFAPARFAGLAFLAAAVFDFLGAGRRAMRNSRCLKNWAVVILPRRFLNRLF